jgi:hypothetical protein
MRFVPLAASVLALAAGLALGWLWLAAVGGAFTALGAYDLLQRRHSVLRNYPISGHGRPLLESIRPELQQYFIERNYDGRPYDRDTRSSIYQRAKGVKDEQAYGTERDVGEAGYEWLMHSTAPLDPPEQPARVRVGGPDCAQPYDMALLNVSAMSFGALSGAALTALNRGAAAGGFAHDTGEGGLTRYHLEDNVGTPLTEGLMIVHNALVGTGLRDRIRIGASGKIATGTDVVKRLAIGADYTNAARAMMMAVGCIQSQRCHTNTCPVGVATQDPKRARALDVPDKTERVRRYQAAVVKEAMRVMASMGVGDPGSLTPHMLMRRVTAAQVRSYAELYHWLEPGELLAEPPEPWVADWARANPDSFAIA